MLLFLLRVSLRARKKDHTEIGFARAALLADDNLLRHRSEGRELGADHITASAAEREPETAIKLS